jgi:hypothetical protein
MNDKQIKALWETSKDEMNVWHDRLHEAPTAHLIELIMFFIPFSMAQEVITEIREGITISRNEEDDNDYLH